MAVFEVKSNVVTGSYLSNPIKGKIKDGKKYTIKGKNTHIYRFLK